MGRKKYSKKTGEGGGGDEGGGDQGTSQPQPGPSGQQPGPGGDAPQQQKGPKQQQQQKQQGGGQQQKQQGGGQQQKGGAQQQQQGGAQQQQQQKGPQQGGQQQPRGSQQHRGGQHGDQQSKGPQQQQQQRGPQQGGPQQPRGSQQQRGDQHGDQQPRGPQQQHQQRGPPQGGQQQHWGPQQQGHPQQRPPQGGQQQQWGPQHGYPQQVPTQQHQQRGPPQGGQQQQWAPQHGYQQQPGYPQQQQWGPGHQQAPPQQQQQRGPPQGAQQQPWAPQHGYQQQPGQQQWGPQPGHQQVPPQQQQQRGPPQRGPQQQRSSQHGQQQQVFPQQQQQGPPSIPQQPQIIREELKSPPAGYSQQERGPREQQPPSEVQQARGQSAERGGPRGQKGQRGGKQSGGQQQIGGPQQPDDPQRLGSFQTMQDEPMEQLSGDRKSGKSQKDRPPSAASGPPPSEGGRSSVPSAPSSTSSAEKITTGVKQLALVKPGTQGRKIIVESNHFALNVGTLKSAIHYDVAIDPDTPKNMLRDVMKIVQQKYYPDRHPAFDGRKNLYSSSRLPFGKFMGDNDITVDREGRPRTFKVEIKFAREVDLTPLQDMLRTQTSPQDALQCVDIVLRSGPSNFCIPVGRSFFTPPRDQIIPLGNGMEMYYGFYQSAIRGWKPLLNVDVAHKAFPRAQNVLDLICELGSDWRNTMTREQLRQGLHRNVESDLDKFIKTLKVKYEIPGQPGSKKNYRVNGLDQSAKRAQFRQDDGSVLTVAEYFRKFKNINLQYPDLPCLWVGSKERRDKKILLPLEFCTIVGGQALNRKMDETQTSAMIKQAATSTTVRKQKIASSLQSARYNQDPSVREFGFSVGNEFERLAARVLKPPTLSYRNNKTVNPSKGVWRGDPNHFFTGATINKWTITSATRYPQKVDRFAEDVVRLGASTGMNFETKAVPYVAISGRQTKSDIMQYLKQRADFDLIFVIVPNSGPQYGWVKQAAELNVGCLTQCIKENTLQKKMNPQTIANILLKVNSKMNGTNHVLMRRPPILNQPCMIMGADVTHPSPDARNIPSVAAVTASHDPQAFRYNICWRLQPPKVEIIEDLCNIVKEQLLYFEKQTKCKPKRIIFFRDGVSEGQFDAVRHAEIAAIKKACKEIQREDYEPAITFLVVQKRHHTRLFPTNPKDSEDRNNNVPAGTCVDTQITNPTMQDFYLVSHASIQGVAKPTKYCTLHDDNDMSNDDIEELTYHLCHMFTRCNRSVSYPAPTYYAHLAAARAKVYIENDNLDMDRLRELQRNYVIRENISKGKPMFFV